MKGSVSTLSHFIAMPSKSSFFSRLALATSTGTGKKPNFLATRDGLVPQIHREEDLHHDAHDDAVHRHVLVQRFRIDALEELDVVLECEELEQDFQQRGDQRCSQEVRMCVGEEVAHLQHLLAVLAEHLRGLLQAGLHVVLEAPPGD
eukprot:CAMPEP_0170337238 /NCGR_PEP_ID=MMETSP0116_2-20130129/69665_1 /TAXON_ID=400756 /ORGANISM="Durinskia baltica, Strain CSIRO CS-38" /LENGTH=146 /DNA_ID=CAMNT_0010590633 /DNA_START=117 /DNA_END=555 /DNA_ORIENTATION=+